jgi:hypothetical protein
MNALFGLDKNTWVYANVGLPPKPMVVQLFGLAFKFDLTKDFFTMFLSLLLVGRALAFVDECTFGLDVTSGNFSRAHPVDGLLLLLKRK